MKEKLHFIGIGGIGMSALARLMIGEGKSVSGSDLISHSMTHHLIKMGASVSLGHDPKRIDHDMTVIYSSGIHQNNPELQAAKKYKCRLLHRSELLWELASQKKSIAITGAHGKTTTSCLLAWVLKYAGRSPTYATGGIFQDNGCHSEVGKGEEFVFEADESDNSFIRYYPYGAIVTNIDLEHMDTFKTEEALIKSYQTFLSQVVSSEHFFWNGDDTRLSAISSKGFSFGFSNHCSLRLFNVYQKRWKMIFSFTFEEKEYKNIELPLIGEHQVMNASSVFGLALKMNIPEDVIRKSFMAFPGVLRRLERKKIAKQIQWIDDYAHHPCEIKKTLKALREAVYPRKLIGVFQPHRYSRVKDYFEDFTQCFESLDHLIVTEIYTAGETPIPGISDESLVQQIRKIESFPCEAVKRKKCVETLHKLIKPHDVIVTIGAGDITYLSDEFKTSINQKKLAKLKVGLAYGGPSPEHHISILSAKSIKEGLNTDFYDINCFGVSKKGFWTVDDTIIEDLSKSHDQEKFSKDVMNSLADCDVIFPVFHGFGEDGTIQGFFEWMGKPYVGPNFRACAIAMNKRITKMLAENERIPVAPYVWFYVTDWKEDRKYWQSQINKNLNYPLYVKPANLGSSLGVKRITSSNELEQAIIEVTHIDDEILVEEEIKGQELEFAILGNEKVTVFPPGEVLRGDRYYDYQAKYGDNPLQVSSRCDIAEELMQKGKEIASKIYKIIGCSGLSRVDLFLDHKGRYWLNEVNPIPGFTSISLYPKICNENGLPFSELIDQLLLLALRKDMDQRRAKRY